MKETILRVIHSNHYRGEVVSGLTFKKDLLTFHCQMDLKQTLIQEQKEDDHVRSLRIKQIAFPPPTFNLKPYSSVSKLELSCGVDIPWVFHISSSLPILQIIRFGTASFSNNNCPSSSLSNLSKSLLLKSPQVRELVINFDFTAKLENEQRDKLLKAMNSILELGADCLTGLMKANLTLPLGVRIDEFLSKCPSLKNNGDKLEVFKHRYLTFITHGNVKQSSSSASSQHSSSDNSSPTSDPRVKKEKDLKRREEPKDPRLDAKRYRTQYSNSSNSRDDFVFDHEYEPTSTTRSPHSDRSSISSRSERRHSSTQSWCGSDVRDYGHAYHGVLPPVRSPISEETETYLLPPASPTMLEFEKQYTRRRR